MLSEHRADGGEVVGFFLDDEVGGRLRVPAGQHVVGGRAVDHHVVSHRADQREVVHLSGEPGQTLADVDVGYGGPDRLELASNLSRCLGLHVPLVVLSGSSVEEEQQARLGRTGSQPAGSGLAEQ